MTNVYIYQAALFCEPCGVSIRENIPQPDHANIDDESTYDSDEWPKGPYPDGGGEADTPQHCDGCGVALNNPLTTEAA